MADTVIRLGNDGLADIRASVLKEVFGDKVAKEVIQSHDSNDDLDPELQEIVDSAPTLDET